LRKQILKLAQEQRSAILIGLLFSVLLSIDFYFSWLVPRTDFQSRYDFSSVPTVEELPSKERIMSLIGAAVPAAEGLSSAEKNVSLKAILRRGTDLIGLFMLANTDGSGKELVKGRLGDQISGWTVASIGSSRVVIQRSEESRELEVLKVTKK
jgi:hypothetical protein